MKNINKKPRDIFFKLVRKHLSSEDTKKSDIRFKIKINDIICHLNFQKQNEKEYLMIYFNKSLGYTISHFSLIECIEKNTKNARSINKKYFKKKKDDISSIVNIFNDLLINGKTYTKEWESYKSSLLQTALIFLFQTFFLYLLWSD